MSDLLSPPTKYDAPASANHRLRVKVCGMKFAENIDAVAALAPDFMGFIFSPNSSRFAADELNSEMMRELPDSLRKVGVFVDQPSDYIRQQVARFALDLVQLHGAEMPAQCAELRQANVQVIKAFSIGNVFDFNALQPYAAHCDYFLFDTKGLQPGGNGTTFDWNILRQYPLSVPYFLAGGLDLEHAETLASLRLPGLFAIDLNSRFEVAPAQKDIGRLHAMLSRLSRSEPQTAATERTRES
ncbi:phosphoribosylanthranilate isomerase [Hymenobacter jejuensis]|uniref:N-(5'-phosphoribosyl)anthranilate isomerase n=1 Tax=Hymenobacter jejuensis TaxID=2502781 RepID=A0A5B7ZUP0_9BACT|nr:phosphoribosylanthranilate isomerase [Hymenobacter jejuensis]QDA58688.1 phosphoribosylanthranilate isomerase [Hymenobacter jejuensis]